MNQIIKISLSSILLLAMIAGCSLPQQKSNTPQPSSTPDVNATVNAAVAATDSAQNGMQATINSSVAATITAIPTPTPMNIDTVTEEEVAAMVDQAVKEALAASTTCATTASNAAADNTVTAEEAQTINVTVTNSNEAIDEATALADQYLALYAEMGDETIALLQQMEEDLSSMSSSTAQIAATLDEINTALQQGEALAEGTINQLKTQAAQIQTQAAEIQTKANGWKEQVSAESEKRANQVDGLQPDQLATDKLGAFQQVSQYVNLIKTSLGDGKLSSSEFAGISKAGANAGASIRQFGGSGGEAFASRINSLTKNLARGETPQARSSLSVLEKDFSGLGGNLRDFSAPNLPKPPTRR